NIESAVHSDFRREVIADIDIIAHHRAHIEVSARHKSKGRWPKRTGFLLRRCFLLLRGSFLLLRWCGRRIRGGFVPMGKFQKLYGCCGLCHQETEEQERIDWLHFVYPFPVRGSK